MLHELTTGTCQLMALLARNVSTLAIKILVVVAAFLVIRANNYLESAIKTTSAHALTEVM
jgi:uncharacterized MnhB-related membrane protein